ncbi:MAG: molybdenum cofactor biosynthesis protein MoaE [Xanthobacteraceae bacterium]|nr:molybdenum cofactor biosynthesis protein MoaE [Xanthobacteraceae bacterium]MBX3523837.1 molybdenum cofactor biosynthesis protein MoaE [Xanthobacteraceae bacterium]MBX3534238.1 molybdenum cofactor biosynthesis protein MoaE [Xanthobacteraceae bacterium]MBX3549185.1 molybdenum cofactor biosynthesis protein MoaE [Xanthobacteraceae bacterium]MCW5675247.1 molybdenum cofactor biosynthesis protein MoaE [Xanthobacteraceae bacterium]
MSGETVTITLEPIDTNKESKAITAAGGNVGALVSFSGICRADEKGEEISALFLEHYPGMAEQEISAHVEEAKRRWPLLSARVVHRVGRIEPGETIVFVATASAHREAAFQAAEFIMDYLKSSAPFWKRTEGGKREAWVEANEKDERALDRWK